ncbi:Cytochrome C oxidase, cbb3-type, subunit III [Dyella sp. OK004]|uniref:c-type cytochrome n=1 Tax=Dyella sp. OK004 TaxID=1855292 RepID=UPI0008EE0111|nr:cytochrome c [Dyella sp. OK004]SFR88645.1 Cytochrome C oxidase, cbb3-type, subunit III [Dyella sp. OK004]
MKRISKAVAAAVLCFASSLHAQSSDNAGHIGSKLAAADGETIFRSICQGCHMPDAKGAQGAGTYPALTGNPRLTSPQYMAAVILHGRRDMPSFKPTPGAEGRFLEDAKLSDTQIAGVINYIRTHFGNQYSDSISAEEVASMHR